MKLKEKSLAELTAMSFTDIAYEILKEDKKTLSTPKLFKKICDLLQYTEEQYESMIGDFYTSLTTDCRFLILDTAEWDLKDKHIVKETVDEDDDEESEEIVEDTEELEEEPEEEEEIIDENMETLDDEDDDMEDLSIIEEEEDED